MIDRTYVVVGLSTPDLTLAEWQASLLGTPAEGDSAEAYALIWAKRVSHRFMRAIFRHESTDGTKGICPAYATRSPGNCRTSSTGIGEPVDTNVVQIINGVRVPPAGKDTYIRYPSWAEGWHDMANRLVSPAYPYTQRGARTIEAIIPIWAPPTDNNNPESYIRAVVAFINGRWPDSQPGGTPVAGAYEHIVPGLVDLRGELKRNPRGGSEGRMPLNQKRGVVIHFNGPDVGANDRQHIINVAAYHCTKDFSANGSGAIGDGIMYHLAIADDGIAYLTRDLEDGLWHCGHAWNRHSFAIYVPIGINQRATPVQLRRLAEVCAALLHFTGEGLDAVRGHMELSATNCPGSLMGDFVRPFRTGQFPAGPSVTPPPVVEPVPAVPGAQLDPWRFDEASRNYAKDWNGGDPFWVLDPFVDWIHANGGLRVMGYVVSGAFLEEQADGTMLLVQYFEGGRLEWYPGNPAEHRVLRGHTGLEVIRTRHPEKVPA